MTKKYDYIVVGAGLYGAMFTWKKIREGKKVLVIDKRPYPGGNIYCENIHGINVHKYGAHIFHTSNKKVWELVNSFVEFNRYTNSPLAYYKGRLYNMPFNMNTFYAMWGVKTPQEAAGKLEEQRKEIADLLRSQGVSRPRRVERTRPCRPRFDRGCHYSGNSFPVMGEQRRIRDFSLSGTKCRKKLFTL